MTLDDKRRAAAIAAIREQAGLRSVERERGRCRECCRPVRFGQVLCERCSLLNVRRVT